MKILWFANTPCSATEKLGVNINSGGWLKSLENELKKVPELKIAICFYSYQYIKPFIYKGTQFYPVQRKGKKNKISRLIKRIFFTQNNDGHEVKELLNIIKEFNPDIIHVHGTEENFGLVQFYTKIPIVISIQGILNPIAEKYFSGIPYGIASRFENVILKLLASGFRQSYKLLEKNAKREKRILKESKHLIGRTDWDRRVTRILAPRSIYYSGNEILRSLFYKNVWGKEQFSDTLQLVTISGNAFYKGFEMIVNTTQILKEYTDLKFVWKVIGLNESNSIVNLIKKWKNVDFQSLNIELMGSKSENEIVAILLDSDIYCQISHIENSPNSLCEAMLLGMPIIATDAGGTSSLIKDQKEGILIQDGDSYSFAGAIIELFTNFKMASEYSKVARKCSLQRHNRTFVKDEYLKTYNEIIENIK
ncbi:MAG: glycosyltransferase [Bacteroidetes bacterium]|nr:glycosyltransferase [Bacteroidota bacterium]